MNAVAFDSLAPADSVETGGWGQAEGGWQSGDVAPLGSGDSYAEGGRLCSTRFASTWDSSLPPWREEQTEGGEADRGLPHRPCLA